MFLLLGGYSYAAPVRFDVDISPNPFTVDDYVDVTIKLIDEDGSVDTSYDSIDAYMEVEGFDVDDPNVSIPGGSLAFFKPSDLGVKIFSKGLRVKEPGTFTFKVVNFMDESVSGQIEIEVLAKETTPQKSAVTVVSPVPNSVEKSDQIDVIGTTKFPSTPIEIFIDGQSFQESISDTNGDFNVFLAGMEPGEHELQVNALDYNDEVVATSGPIPFTYEPAGGDLFLGVEVQPSNQLKVNQKATIIVTTAERVTSAMLQLSNGDRVPAEKAQPGQFRKQVSFPSPGVYPLDVFLSVNGNESAHEGVETITVTQDEERRILDVQAQADDERRKADLTWTYAGSIEYFKIMYGTARDNLRLSLTTSEPKGTLILADPSIPYYVQIYPVDQFGVTNGVPSEIITIGPKVEPIVICGNRILEGNEQCDDGNIFDGDGCNALCQVEQRLQLPVCGDGVREGQEQCDDGNQFNGDGCNSFCVIEARQPICGDGKKEGWEQCDDGNFMNGDGCAATCLIEVAPTCYPDGIKITTKKVGEQYYLAWSPVPQATEYIIYRAEQAVSTTAQMSVVGRTAQTSFEYPFDPNSEVDRWAWYAVEAVCPNNDQKQVGDVTQVKVGPEKTILIMFMLMFMGFMGWRLMRV